jgi:hypothetical protein
MRHRMSGVLVILIMLLGVSAAAAPVVITKTPVEVALPPNMVGPTENITKVLQAITTRAKSLTTLVVFPPGIQITQPVTISIGYYGAGHQRITQTYVPSSGNHFLHNDTEGDGKPRQMSLAITFEEPKPEGGIHTFTWLISLFLDPLYDVTIGPVSFTLVTDCDWFGNSEIIFRWTWPDSGPYDVQHFPFSTRAGQLSTIDAFKWNRTEVSASDGLSMPWIAPFKEEDPGFYYPGLGPAPQLPLVPGTTRQVVESLKEGEDQCSASVEYTITYTLRWYPYL